MGNLAPLAVVGPGLAASIWEVALGGLTPRSLGVVAAAAIAGWLSINFLGLTGNTRMKREMRAILDRERPGDAPQKWFVGFARPRFKGLLDPHEDVGYLIVEQDWLIFWGELRRVELHRDQVVRIHHRPNIHSLLGLGRWVAVEAVLDGKPARLLIEPREKRTLIGNLILSARIKASLTAWARDPSASSGPRARERRA